MLLRALDPLPILRDKSLDEFLSLDRPSARKLKPSQFTEFNILRRIGSGVEGIVFECRTLGSDVPLVLKLFFHAAKPRTQSILWPLRNEARYYASCEDYKLQLSKRTMPPPMLPKLSHARWAHLSNQLRDQDLFAVIQSDLLDAPQEQAEYHQTLAVLEKMCAWGWVAFSTEMRQYLRDVLLPHETFTGDVMMAIVKPYLQQERWEHEHSQRQMHTMALMRAFGWKLRDVKARNWINGYLVDGGDVEVQPKYRRHLERSWNTAFFEFIKEMDNLGQGRFLEPSYSLNSTPDQCSVERALFE